MGAEIIQAKYEELDTIAARFKNRAEANAELCSHIERCFQALERDWEGKGANAFCAEMKGELFPAMRRLTDALEQAEAVTLEVKNIIQQAEEEAANLFSTNGRTAPSSQSGSEEGAFSKVLGFMGDLFVGAGSELVDMVKGIGNLIIHPVDTLKGLAYGITHPGELWDAFKKPYVDDWNNGHPGRSIGRGLMFVGSLLVGTKGADKAAKALGITGRGAKSLSQLFRAGRVPKASRLVRWAERQGWKPVQTPTGPLKFVDENGVVRMKIKRGSPRTPGSERPHIELRNADGQRIDPFGNPVARRSSGNHTPIDFDLP